jgi:hypothetical protein
MAECANDLVNLDPSCNALRKKGGLKKKVWLVGYDKATLTVDVDGNIDTITLATASPVNVLNTYTGKKLKHNGALTGEVGENTTTIKQDLNLVLYYYTQAERDSIDTLFQAEEVLAFVQTEAGQIECWGYETGLAPSALTGGSGTALNDSTAVTVALSGQQDTLPKVCSFGANLAADIAYLDALT